MKDDDSFSHKIFFICPHFKDQLMWKDIKEMKWNVFAFFTVFLVDNLFIFLQLFLVILYWSIIYIFINIDR